MLGLNLRPQSVILQRHGGVVAPWTPARLSNTKYAYDFTDASSITQSGGTISQINEQYGGPAMVQPTAGSQPTYNSTGLNGKPAAVNAGSTFLWTAGLQALPQTWTALVIASLTALSGTQSLFDADGAGTGSSLSTARESQILRTSAAVLQTIGFNTSNSAFTAQQGSVAAGTPFIGVSENSGGAARVGINAQATLASTAITGTVNAVSQQLALFRIVSTAVAQPAKGAIGYAIFVATALSLADRQKLEGFVAWKFNLASLLPAAHPYKSRAPLITD